MLPWVIDIGVVVVLGLLSVTVNPALITELVNVGNGLVNADPLDPVVYGSDVTILLVPWNP